MVKEDKKNKTEELKAKRQEATSIKSELQSLHEEKERWFQLRKKYSQAITRSIGEVKIAKGKRNAFTDQVKKGKARRQELNDQIKVKVAELKILNAEKRKVASKFGIKEDPAQIRKEMELIDLKIETSALPFEKEKELMKELNQKKKLLASMKKVSGAFEKAHLVAAELDKLRKKADETHKKIQKKASESQERHEELIATSKDIDELKKKEKEALYKFAELKDKYGVVNVKLKALFDEIKPLQGAIDKFDETKKKKSQETRKKALIERVRDVEEKIKKRQKLTTEDLLAFQAKEMAGGRKAEKKK